MAVSPRARERGCSTGCFDLQAFFFFFSNYVFACVLAYVLGPEGLGVRGEAPQRLPYPRERELRVRVKGGREMWVETENGARVEGKNADDK